MSASDHLLEHVAAWKKEIRQKLSGKKKILFIGVHNRRTDFYKHYKIISNSTLVDQVYFNTAFEMYRYVIDYIGLKYICRAYIFSRKKYNDAKNRVIFLAVSDDNQWIKVTR